MWRLWHTLRHLRAVQVWGRLWYRLHRPRPDRRPPPPVRPADATWQPCARRSCMTGPATFRFLDVERTLTASADWNNTAWPRLWLYNLHYFDDLVARNATARTQWHRDLVTRWVRENPPARGAGWEPYPTSLRIVNWVKWALAGHALDTPTRHSLAMQTRWLRRRLEWHLLGNHLWANAKALVFAGVYFQGDEANRWRACGMRLLRRQLAEQILNDGGHFERSPMYHAIVLEDLLDLLQLARLHPQPFDAADIAQWRETAARMLRWLRVMTHPDGDIALFNDAAVGIAPDWSDLAAYADGQGVALDATPLATLEILPDSGYARLQAGAAVLIADVGEIGPDYLPGHAHADTLSFELSLHGRRLLVNGGTSTYAEGAERLRQRGTAAHNTVTIEGQDSSEVWASFRVARRARPLHVGHGTDADGLCLRAAHDGYRRLPGRPLHRREWRLSATGLHVVDSIDGAFRQACAHIRVHPDWRVDAPRRNAGVITLRDDPIDAQVPIRWQAGLAATVQDDAWHPRFGVTQACSLITIPFDASPLTFAVTWD